jgi:hypothetical protein
MSFHLHPLLFQAASKLKRAIFFAVAGFAADGVVQMWGQVNLRPKPTWARAGFVTRLNKKTSKKNGCLFLHLRVS